MARFHKGGHKSVLQVPVGFLKCKFLESHLKSTKSKSQKIYTVSGEHPAHWGLRITVRKGVDGEGGQGPHQATGATVQRFPMGCSVLEAAGQHPRQEKCSIFRPSRLWQQWEEGCLRRIRSPHILSMRGGLKGGVAQGYGVPESPEMRAEVEVIAGGGCVHSRIDARNYGQWAVTDHF